MCIDVSHSLMRLRKVPWSDHDACQWLVRTSEGGCRAADPPRVDYRVGDDLKAARAVARSITRNASIVPIDAAIRRIATAVLPSPTSRPDAASEPTNPQSAA